MKLSDRLEQAHSLALAVGDDYSDLVREAAALEADLERTCAEAGAHALYIKELSAEKAALEAQIERLQSGTEIESDHMTELDVQHLKALARIYELETENEFLKKEVRREWLSGYEECGQETDAKVSALEAANAFLVVENQRLLAQEKHLEVQLGQVRDIVTNRDWYALGGAKDKDMLDAIAKTVGAK